MMQTAEKLTDQQERYNDQDKYREDLKKASDIKPSVPDFVSKTKEYIKLHPEVIREVAGDEMAKVEAYLDTLPFGLGAIGKTKLNEFLGAKSTGDNQGGGKEGSGREIGSQDGQGQDNQPESEPEDFMTTLDVRDIIEYMADLSEQGFSLPEIADAVWRDYRIEYHPLKIKRMLKTYYSKPDEDEDKSKGSVNMLKMYQKLFSEKNLLQAAVSELTAKLASLSPKPELTPVVKKGLIRKAWALLW